MLELVCCKDWAFGCCGISATSQVPTWKFLLLFWATWELSAFSWFKLSCFCWIIWLDFCCEASRVACFVGCCACQVYQPAFKASSEEAQLALAALYLWISTQAFCRISCNFAKLSALVAIYYYLRLNSLRGIISCK